MQETAQVGDDADVCDDGDVDDDDDACDRHHRDHRIAETWEQEGEIEDGDDAGIVAAAPAGHPFVRLP